jgi:ketosteroid isomerase-like protein
MDEARLQTWLDAYVDAWRTYDREAIAALFAEDATYAYHPYDEPLRGRDAIASSWLSEQDAPGSWEATYRPLMFDGDRAIATGETRYSDGNVFSNLFVLRFDGDGRCTGFVEYYVHHPKDRATA